MINAVLEPSILFISQSDWENEPIKVQFLHHLLDTLHYNTKYSLTSIIWNDDLEYCVWGDEQIPPWRVDRDTKNTLVPIIYHAWQSKKIKCINYRDNEPICNTSPTISCCKSTAKDCFLKLMHYLICINEIDNIILCLGIINKLSSGQSYIFSCDCCKNIGVPSLINDPIECLNYVDLTDDYYWTNSDTFNEALEITRIIYYNKPFLYNFYFSANFLSSLPTIEDDRLNLLKQIVKRLMLCSNEAIKNKSLQDEYISRTKQYRFRITKSTRIHYIFTPDNHIFFLNYYGQSKHNKGLN